MKNITVVTQPEPMSLGYTRIQHWAGDAEHNQFIQLDVRRLQNEKVDEAQIELMLSQTPVHGKRTTKIHGCLVFRPEDARALALALCPELAK